MRRSLMLASIAVALSACAMDPYRERRPARFLVGATGRQLGNAQQQPVAARTETPSSSAEHATGAFTGTGQFTMGYRNILAGVEFESGRLDATGSNFAGAYGVLGAEHATSAGSIGVEVVSGWRAIRFGRDISDGDDISTMIIEPRVRGQYRIGEQVSVGGVAGATLGDQGSWMFGVNIGFHSRAFGY